MFGCLKSTAQFSSLLNSSCTAAVEPNFRVLIKTVVDSSFSSNPVPSPRYTGPNVVSPSSRSMQMLVRGNSICCSFATPVTNAGLCTEFSPCSKPATTPISNKIGSTGFFICFSMSPNALSDLGTSTSLLLGLRRPHFLQNTHVQIATVRQYRRRNKSSPNAAPSPTSSSKYCRYHIPPPPPPPAPLGIVELSAI